MQVEWWNFNYSQGILHMVDNFVLSNRINILVLLSHRMQANTNDFVDTMTFLSYRSM